MNNQTIAQQLQAQHENQTDLLLAADKLAVEKDQNWEEESTTFTFKDDSELTIKA